MGTKQTIERITDGDSATTDIGTITVLLSVADNEANTEQWVHLLPAGRFSGRDGRGPWHTESLSQVIENTRQYAGKNSLPVDYEHQIDLAPKNGQPAPAAGWIVGLKADEQGIWGLVNWTEKAAEHLKAKEYRYLSPVISYTKDGSIVRILRAALTNNPALELTALAKSEDTSMPPSSELAEIKALLGLEDQSSHDELITTLKSLKSGPDLTGYVPLGEFQRVESEFSDFRKGQEEKTLLAKVEDAVDSCLLPASLKEWGISMCRHNEAGFDEFLNSIKVIYGFMQTCQTDRLTAEEKALLNNTGPTKAKNEIFTALGLSQDDIKRYGA